MAANSTLRSRLCRQRIRNGWTRTGGRSSTFESSNAMTAMVRIRIFSIGWWVA
jgi:hypothetical protein